MTIGRRLMFALLMLMGAGLGSLALADPLSDLYQAKAIVTGTGETNRELGFRKCLDDVLLRVSGDQRLLSRREMPALRDKAGSFVSEFRYRDRLEGRPVRDEQGTHDRPHDLTCLYNPETVDAVLKSLGSRPWLDKRPKLVVLLGVKNAKGSYVLASDEASGRYMQESLLAAAQLPSLSITIPPRALLARDKFDFNALQGAGMKDLDTIAITADGDQALAGSLIWSDKDLGWVAEWRLATKGKVWRWGARGISFDDAFRLAMRGAAQILSGNGQP